MTTIVCPQCGKDDAIQKVTAIYSAGVTSGTYSGPSVGAAAPIGSGNPSIIGGYTKLSGGTQTALSARLAPPVNPKPNYPSGCWFVIPVLGFIPPFTFIVITPILMLLAPVPPKRKKMMLMVIGGGLAFGVVAILIGNLMDSSYGSLSSTLQAFFLIVIGISIVISIITNHVIYYKGLSEESRKQKEAYDSQVLPVWQKRMANWDKLYYCSRDDCVFNPFTGASAQADQIKGLFD